MKFSEAYPGKYLKAADVKDKPFTLIIDRVEYEKVGVDDDEPKPVVYFTKVKRGLVLNKTCGNAIVAAYGDEMEDWNGLAITLFHAVVPFGNKMVEAIRVRIPKAAAAPKPAPQSHDELNPPSDIDDDFPL